MRPPAIGGVSTPDTWDGVPIDAGYYAESDPLNDAGGIEVDESMMPQGGPRRRKRRDAAEQAPGVAVDDNGGFMPMKNGRMGREVELGYEINDPGENLGSFVPKMAGVVPYSSPTRESEMRKNQLLQMYANMVDDPDTIRAIQLLSKGR
jgi:hypothetical protein